MQTKKANEFSLAFNFEILQNCNRDGAVNYE